MFTRSKLRGCGGEVKEVLTFGPLSVLPEYQRQGYGKALLDHALDRAAELGFEAVVIFGNPENYVERGFKNGKRYNVAVAEEFDKTFPQMPKEYRPSQELFYIYSNSRLNAEG